MLWIIFIVIVAIIGLIYLFLPLIKKMFEKKFSSTSREEKKELKKSIKKDKKEQKVQKKLNKKQEKEEKQILQIEKKNQKEDPDLKVDNNNLDIDGFFKTDFNSSKDTNLFSENDSINQDYDDIFDKLFNNDRGSLRKGDYNIDELTSYDPIKENEIRDYLTDDNTGKGKDIGKMIEELPPEIKALLLSDALDKKDY